MGVGDVGMNESACTALVESVVWHDPTRLTLLFLLGLIDIMVVLGNCLVIAAVYMSSKLRSVTNYLIVSLAVADLMVGLAVLPFSATWEVFKVWIFGDVWCSAWLALDVWMCTASILNLCAISLDRYVAVTRPVTYPSIMSTSRAKILIASVWVLSFLICFPPLVGWKDTTQQQNAIMPEGPGRPLTPGGATVIQWPTAPPTEEPPCPWRCELTNDAGYVIYSALGSFYLPMFVMLFFYWRIYRAAVQTTRAINQGFKLTKGSKGIGNRFDEQRLTLRIHRGRGSVMQGSTGSNSTTTTNSAANSLTNSPGGGGSAGGGGAGGGKSPEKKNTRRHERIKISVSYPSSDAISAANNNSPPPTSPKSSISSSSPPPSGQLFAVHYTGNETSSVYRKDPNCHLRVGSGNRMASHRRARRTSSDGQPARPRLLGDPLSVTIQKDLSPSPTYDENNPTKPKLISRMGKRNIKAQVKRFRMETKAAKTLGIIVGGFIFCWLPFFTMYLVLAFCGDECINPVVFSVLFWLGYCNSAINPCIYALFSKDFRFAFKRIICKCICTRERGQRGSSRYTRRGSDASHLGIRRNDQRSSSLNNNELIPNHHHGHHHSDSDANNEAGSESR